MAAMTPAGDKSVVAVRLFYLRVEGKKGKTPTSPGCSPGCPGTEKWFSRENRFFKNLSSITIGSSVLILF